MTTATATAAAGPWEKKRQGIDTGHKGPIMNGVESQSADLGPAILEGSLPCCCF
jgi:hypothetical protein